MPAGTDIFKSFEFVNNLQRKYYDNEGETTLMIGSYGAQTEIAASLLQKALVVAAENSGEAIPTKAKYEKNIIAHARFVGINDINATPARMQITLALPKGQIDSNLKQNKFTIDKNCKFMIENYEFHLDYDIVITRTRLRTNEYVYTAMYDINQANILSDVDSPNLPPVGVFNTVSGELLTVMCQIRQVQVSTIYNKIMTDNTIENKTLTFTYEDQLASFDVDVTEGNIVYHLNPVYDGTINNSKEKYCEYQDIDSSTIRIKFNRDSYLPRINADVAINIKTTKGFGGVFEYVGEDIVVDLKSDKYGYSGLNCLIKPLSDSYQGIDRKTVSELKSIIPKEALSRGSIINTIDLESFFNSTNLENSKLYFYKKKYNQLEHLYYSYLLMKYGNTVVPTNTVNILVSTEDIENNGKNWYIKPLSTFTYNTGDAAACIQKEETDIQQEQFVYTNPFMIGINKNPLVISYFLTTFKSTKYLNFDYVNQASALQFVATNISLSRSAFSDKDKYKLGIDMAQNINNDFGLVIKNEDGTFDSSKIKVFLLLYNDTDSVVWRYAEATFVSFDQTDFTYNFKFELDTDNTISDTNLMKITNLKQPETGIVVDSYIGNGIKADVLIMANTTTFYGNDGYSTIIPGTTGFSLCNRYGVRDGIDLFYNYTQMMSSTPIVRKGDIDGTYQFTIDKVPMIKKSYITDESRMWALIDEIQNRRKYIEYCLNILEDGFDIDFKFFNTYGPANRFTLDGETPINRVNLSIKFRTKLYSNAEKYLIDIIKDEIKANIEDIGNISDIHMTNIAEEIRRKYNDQLEYFEFVDFNDYGPGETHIYQLTNIVKEEVPEFLNINTSDNGTPDIEIMDR